MPEQKISKKSPRPAVPAPHFQCGVNYSVSEVLQKKLQKERRVLAAARRRTSEIVGFTPKIK